MALTKIKVNEIDEKPAPVAGDYALASDSENNGKLALIPFSGIPLPATAMTTDTNQTVSGVKTFRATNQYYGPAETTSTHYPFVFGSVSTPFWRTTQYPGGNLVIQCKPTESAVWQNALAFIFQLAGTIPYVQLYNNAVGVTQSADNNSTRLATTAFVQAQKASPALTGTPTAPTASVGTNTTQIATTEFASTSVAAATANAIYDLPVTRSGLVASGTDVILLETANAINAAWYDTTHVLNVSLFLKNDSEVVSSATFKVQLYDAGNSTAHTIASITADTFAFNLFQASIYRASESSVNCNIKYGTPTATGYVSLASGSYKLRVVCTSTLDTRFAAAQVRFTK